MPSTCSNDASNASGTINSGDGSSRNDSLNVKDDSNSRIVSMAACKSRAPATSMLLQQQCSCNISSSATADTCNIRKLATAGTIVQTARTPVTKGPLKGRLKQQGSCNSRAPGAAGLLQQQGSCNSRAPGAAGLLEQQGSCNSKAPATAGHLQQQGSCNSRAPAIAGFLQQQGSCNSRAPATAGCLQKQIVCNSRDASNLGHRQQQSDTRNIRQI